ncbi:MAG: substrate-binding domain-containing protein [Actinomycetota bacterium]|jgi:urea transport system substrate-binding protein|nr:substrate-binding domain-containing protein [Actinomycetota bacterium]
MTLPALLTQRPARRPSPDALDVALVIPLHGPAGLVGPSSELCAQLAAEEANATTGVLGRELRFTIVDGGSSPEQVADEVEHLVGHGLVEAVVGWHISAVRRALAPRIAHLVPYVYSALYEGGEQTPGVFLTGETPDRQLRPAITWLRDALDVHRWTIVGDDYVWPRRSAACARRYIADSGGQVRDSVFVGLGTTDFVGALRRVEGSGCDAVLMLLVGEDAVQFNRQFAERGLDEHCLRLSPLMEENMLLGTGASGTRGLYSAAGYFESLTTPGSLDFGGRFCRRFGAEAPVLNSLGESCYEAVRLLAELLARAGTADVSTVCLAADGVSYDGPRGEVRLEGNHLQQRVYLARADALEFEVLASL